MPQDSMDSLGISFWNNRPLKAIVGSLLMCGVALFLRTCVMSGAEDLHKRVNATSNAKEMMIEAEVLLMRDEYQQAGKMFHIRYIEYLLNHSASTQIFALQL